MTQQMKSSQIHGDFAGKDSVIESRIEDKGKSLLLISENRLQRRCGSVCCSLERTEE